MSRRVLPAVVAACAALAAAVFTFNIGPSYAAANEDCRPDGLARSAGVDAPYCAAYDTNGREKMGAGVNRRVIGYFTNWRTGTNGAPAYLVNNIPWNKVTHLNYAFAHVDGANKLSVGGGGAANASTGMTWPGVPGAEMDPSFPYQGHFNLLNKFKKQYPNVKTLVSVGGWAETGGYFDDNGTRVASGGFYTMTESQAKIDTFADSAVSFIRQYGFNGVDIDYEYPTSNKDAGNPLDFTVANAKRGQLMAGYVNLMRTLKQKLDAASAADGKYYMLTAAVPASGWLLRGMDVYQVTQYLDYVNVMTYDLHGAWNEYVGPNAALFDNGQDSEMIAGSVYSSYGQIGYLNGDWALHYFRGSMPAGRINLGLPYYTRGWEKVTGGTNGLWGTSKGSPCPAGTTVCGAGAIGIDNLWHDDKPGTTEEEPAGSNPMWHAKNLQQGIPGDYLAKYGLDPNLPKNKLTGTYTRNYNATMAAPWLWNDQKKVFLSTEDDVSVNTKAQYIADNGYGGAMMWELAGDYAWDAAKGQYFMGNTLTTALYDKLQTGAPYGATKSNKTMPTATLDVGIDVGGFPVGDSNYPITGKMKVTNRSTVDIPGSAKLEFDMPVSTTAEIGQQTGWTLTVTPGRSGSNSGGLKADFHHVTMTLPSWQTIPKGASAEVVMTWKLPVSGPSNYTLTFGGTSYRLSADHPRGGTTNPTTAPPTTAPPTTRPPTTAPPTTAPPTTAPPTTRPPTTAPPTTAPPTTQPPTCSVAAWTAATVYNGGAQASYNGRIWKAKWWTQGETPGVAAVWENISACGPATSSPPGTCTTPPWVTTTAYSGGAVVVHNGKKYRAKWWTQGETPGTAAVWEDLGTCNS
ncbi:glycosyl hydrolase family 18 protein [Longispora urticae]